MNIHPIKTERDYDQTLARIDALMEAEPGSPAADELDVLVTLVEAYEAKHHPILPPDPVDAVYFQMEELGLTSKDLEPYIGNSARVSAVLNRKRPLTLPMIRRLHNGRRIPLEALVMNADRRSFSGNRADP